MKKKENQLTGMTRQEIIQEAKKQILHSAVLALAALIVIGVACYAWFANNKSVTAGGATVSVAEAGFELASVDSDGNLTQTSASNQSISWQMNGESNLENYEEDLGIGPGSEGKLKFYVIPKQSGNLKVSCTLEIAPCLFDKDADPQTAENLLRGHLLFDYQYNGSHDIKLVDIENGSFDINLVDAQVDDPVEVTLNWRWPYVLEDAYRGSYAEVLNWVISDDRSKYFYCGENGAEVDIGTIPIESFTAAKYLELSDYYNNADQYIGKNVETVILRLTAEPG